MKLLLTEQHDIISGIANVFLFIAIIFLVIYSLAPLFGGKFLFSAIILYGSWAAFAICLKLESKFIKDKTFKDIRLVILTLIELICIISWFSYPYNIVCIAIFSLLKLCGYKKLSKIIEAKSAQQDNQADGKR